MSDKNFNKELLAKLVDRHKDRTNRLVNECLEKIKDTIDNGVRDSIQVYISDYSFKDDYIPANLAVQELVNCYHLCAEVGQFYPQKDTKYYIRVSINYDEYKDIK